jgi:hypothetical protein
VGVVLSDSTGAGVIVVDSEEEFREITVTARIIIPTTTATTTAFDEPPPVLELGDKIRDAAASDFGAVEIDEIEALDEPLIGTAGIKFRVVDLALLFALFFAILLVEDVLAVRFTLFALFLALRLADDFLAAFFFAAT